MIEMGTNTARLSSPGNYIALAASAATIKQ